jgi:hypothetical protein
MNNYLTIPPVPCSVPCTEHCCINPVPRREHPLILDSAEYDKLFARLMSQLRPPNILAEHLIAQLAQELLKLQFSQRVEFALIDRVQMVDDAGLRRMRQYQEMRTGGKTIARCHQELVVLVALRQAFAAGEKPAVAEADVPWLTEMLWHIITRAESSCNAQHKQLDEIDEALDVVTAEDEQDGLLQRRQKVLDQLQESEEDDKTCGCTLHGLKSIEDLKDVLSGKVAVPDSARELWEATVALAITIVSEQRALGRDWESHIENLRNEALRQAAERLPQLTPIQQHAAAIWRNIERCIRQLALLGADLEGLGPAPGTSPPREA